MAADRYNILIVAGEPSGDMRAGELLKDLTDSLPGVSFWGIGGDNMLEKGVELIEHVRDLSVAGVWEAIKNYPKIRAQYRNCVENIRQKRPIAAILIDYPGFNLRLAKYLHKENIPVIYYVIPQVWAWGRNRIKLLKRCMEKIIVLFAFEKRFLKEHGIEAEFVGHPLVEKIPESSQPAEGHAGFTLALVPGSRETEIKRIFPTILDTAEMIHRDRGDIDFILAESSNVEGSLYDSILSGHAGLDIRRVKDDTIQALALSDFAIVTSGTATLETALMEKPMIITYITSFLTAVLFRLFVRLRYLGIVNIIAGKEVAPEFLQEAAVPERMSKKTLEMIGNDGLLNRIKGELKKVKTAVGEKGAPKRAAEIMVRFIEKKKLICDGS